MMGAAEEQRREFSVFVDNLPHELDRFGLKGIFQRAGSVSDVYIPQRRSRRNPTRFGFVRFWSKGDAIKSIHMLNNATVRGRKILVSMARYGKRRQRQISFESSRVWRKKKQEQNQMGKNEVQIVRMSQESQPYRKRLQGQVNSEFEEWLNRSLVCTS
uniref:RRM domain-containing protein n=1 Tax=Opuntia streptacantha TaxID=393608 RepID=A0A7C9D911_OPUST